MWTMCRRPCRPRPGPPGRLSELPATVSALEREWSMTVGRAFTDSTEAYVARARLADGTPAVLKVLVPRGHRDTLGREMLAAADRVARHFRM